MADIFLSYSTKNRDFVLRLKKDLERMNYSTWMDNQAIKGGDEWVKEIDENLRACSIFLVTVSKDSNKSSWVRREAIQAEQLGKKRIPLLLNDNMPFHLLDLQYIDFRKGYSAPIQKLEEVLNQCRDTHRATNLEAEAVQDTQPPSSSFFGSFFSGLWRTLSGSSRGTDALVPASAEDELAATNSAIRTLPSSPEPSLNSPPKGKRPRTEAQHSTNHRSPSKKHKSNSTMVCGKCACRLTKDHFSSKQWEKGKQKRQQQQQQQQQQQPSDSKKRFIFCRRCEEKLMVKQQLSPELEKQCTRLHIAKSGRSKFLAAIVPKANNNNDKGTSSAVLPRDLTLDGYTRAKWSLSSNTEGWQTTTVVAMVGADSMKDFLEFLKQHKKAAYGRFLLPNKTDGFLCIPFDQPLIITNNKGDEVSTASKPNQTTISIELSCKYALGLGLGGQKGQKIVQSPTARASEATTTTTTAETETEAPYSPERNPEEDYVSSSMLGSLLAAQRKTDQALAMVPQGSVRRASVAVVQNPVIFENGDEY